MIESQKLPICLLDSPASVSSDPSLKEKEGVICKLRGALLGHRTMSAAPSQACSGRFSHLKDLTKGARNSIGVWWLVAGGWLQHRQQK